jgi:hypothetical protein
MALISGSLATRSTFPGPAFLGKLKWRYTDGVHSYKSVNISHPSAQNVKAALADYVRRNWDAEMDD